MLDRSVEEGGILLVSGTPRPLPRVPPTLLYLSVCLSVCLSGSRVPLSLRVHVVLAVLRGFFFVVAHGTANPSMPTRPASKSAAIGGSIVPSQGFLLGIAPAGWQNACGGPRVSIPGLAGLACPLLLCLGGHSSALGGASKGLTVGSLRGRDCNPVAQTARWKVRPGAVTVWAHRPQTASQTDRWMTKLADPATTNHKTTTSTQGQYADADLSVSSRAQS